MTEQDDKDDLILPEEEEEMLKKLNIRNHRGSCLADELQYRSSLCAIGDSVLGLVHHEMAKYHEIGRFSVDDKVDWAAALYHEKMAADLGIMEAIITVAKLYLGQEPDVLVGCEVKPSTENHQKGIEYMDLAAELGDRAAMLYMAQAYETGQGLDNSRQKSYRLAVYWYNKALTCTGEDEDGGYDATMDNPPYIIKAKQAAMYLEGGYELDKDPSYAGDLYNEAAEDAMAKMKGRLANKYYALAEEAYGQVEEE
jgi:elongation factor 2 kinase